MEIGSLIFVRMNSVRLFGKCLRYFSGHPPLHWLTRQLKHASYPFVVCTSTNPLDDAVEQYCCDNDLPFYRGPESNVLQRMRDAMHEFGFSHVIRITGDDIFIDPRYLQQGVKEYNGCQFAYSDMPKGSDFEIIRGDFVEKLHKQAASHGRVNTEYLTWYFNCSPERQRLLVSPELPTTYAFEYDDADDAERIGFIIDKFKHEPYFRIEKLLALAKENPGMFPMKNVLDDKQEEL